MEDFLELQHQNPVQQTQEADWQRRYNDCEGRLHKLYVELEKVMYDIDQARELKQPAGPLYTEKQRLHDDIERVGKDKEKCRPVREKEPELPNMNDRQIALATSVVGRNEAFAFSSNINR